MVQRRSITTALTASFATVALAACNGSGTDVSEPDPDEPIDLRMTVWTADESQLALFDDIADAYIAENPDLVSSVTFESLPFDDYTTSLTTQLAGGNTPDLAWIFESTAPEFVGSGALADLRPALEESEGYEYEDLLPAALELWSQDDGLYAYPFSNSPFAVFVNTDRIDEAGLPDPQQLLADGEWTFDAMRELSAESADEIGGHGMEVRDFNYSIWENLAMVWGGWDAEAWTADGTECGFTQPEMVEAMSWLHEAIFVDGALPGPGSTPDFFGGDMTFSITQISRASALDGSFEWDLIPLPAGPAGQQNVIGQAGLGVLQNGQDPAVAADFLAYFTNPENAEALAAYFPPPREALLDAAVLAEGNPMLSQEQLEAVVVGGIDGAITKPAHVNFAQLQSTIRGELDSLWTAQADVDAVLADVCEAAQPLLED